MNWSTARLIVMSIVLQFIIIMFIIENNVSANQFVEFYSDYKNNHREDKVCFQVSNTLCSTFRHAIIL